MKKLILQAVRLIKQNPFYSLVAIVGTAVTIAFVMVVIMIYEFRSADMAPETDRSRLMYTDTGTTQYPDGTTTYKGMGSAAYEALFVGLPGVEDATWHAPIKKGVRINPNCDIHYASSVGVGEDNDEIRLIFVNKKLVNNEDDIELVNESNLQVILNRNAAIGLKELLCKYLD